MSKNLPMISVIMSVHNGEKYLVESIESILNQSYEDFEFLIMDDASDDNSSDIIKDFARIDGRIITFKSNINIGLTKSLNILIKNSRSELLARMDGDDISIRNRLEIQYDFMKKNKHIDFVGTGANLIDKNSNFICHKYVPIRIEEVIKSMPYFNHITHPTVMMRKAMIQRNGYYNEKYKTGQDWELWQRNIKNGVEFEILKDKLLLLRIVPGSLSSWQTKKKGSSLHLGLLSLHNNARLDSLKYFSLLTFFEKIYFCIHFMIPFKIFRLILKYYQLYYPKSEINFLKKIDS